MAKASTKSTLASRLSVPSRSGCAWRVSIRPASPARAALRASLWQFVRFCVVGGSGVIVNSEGAGNDARLQVNFGRNGVKWLALAYAKLERV